jgi:cellulose synthase/poly-beta-1,6-N-acetylglucosamine synthase-like glycosyltransferase
MDPYYFFLYVLAYIGLALAVFYILSMSAEYKSSKKQERTDLSVSILIPAYNEEKSIVRTIESAIALDYPKENLEIIVINDGSKDSTKEKVEEYLESLKKNNYSGPEIRFFSKPNGGKGTALNYGIDKAEGEIIISMDADTFANKDVVKKMMGYFYDDKVMSVTPTMGVYQPKNFWQKIQQIEYALGTFMRKSFALLDSMHVTPGAFAAYRKEFFIKHGKYDVGNLTEDIEIALRIQKYQYRIENTPEAVVYTICPYTFRQLLAQRKRWYTGYIKNIWNYRELFTPKYGVLGTVILPIALFSLFTGIFMLIYTFLRGLNRLSDKIILMNSIGFRFQSPLDITYFAIENFVFKVISTPVFWISVLFTALILFYLYFSKKTMKYKDSVFIGFFLYLALYSILYCVFWMISLFYMGTKKEVKWK